MYSVERAQVNDSIVSRKLNRLKTKLKSQVVSFIASCASHVSRYFLLLKWESGKKILSNTFRILNKINIKHIFLLVRSASRGITRDDSTKVVSQCRKSLHGD